MPNESLMDVLKYLTQDSVIGAFVLAVLSSIFAIWRMIKDETRVDSLDDEEKLFREELRNEIHELKGENEELKDEKEALREEIHGLRMEIAEALAELHVMKRLIELCREKTNVGSCPILIGREEER